MAINSQERWYIMSTKKAILWVIIWISVAICFGLGVTIFGGHEKALEFFAGYVIELSLSIDNLFLFIILFTSFGIKPQHQRRVLNYGIFGAIILRLVFILLGVTVVHKFEWILYIFGIILIASGAKMMFKEDDNKDYSNSKIIKLLGKFIPITNELEDEKFFVKKSGILHATPLFAILVLIEFTDILFAIDSIPAIFSVTTDTFIIYSSNILAIMGLRSLYFVLGSLHEKFQYVKYGVALILAFTGVKLFILVFHLKIPVGISLIVIFSILVGSIIFSVIFSDKKKPIEPKEIEVD